MVCDIGREALMYKFPKIHVQQIIFAHTKYSQQFGRQPHCCMEADVASKSLQGIYCRAEKTVTYCSFW